jgi:hypothetical protein
LRRILSIPDEVTPVGVILIGYPEADKRSPSLQLGRRQFDESIHREIW